MRYWLDTEFVDTGSAIELISIGIVSETGRELYLENANFDWGWADQWVRDNVLAHLKGGESRWPLRSIQATLRDFFDIEDYGKPEIWGWCAGYDFVAFCQIFGTMMDLPAGYPHYIRDLQYILDERGIKDDELPRQEEGLHNALADAKHIKRLWEWLHGQRQERPPNGAYPVSWMRLEHRGKMAPNIPLSFDPDDYPLV